MKRILVFIMMSFVLSGFSFDWQNLDVIDDIKTEYINRTDDGKDYYIKTKHKTIILPAQVVEDLLAKVTPSKMASTKLKITYDVKTRVAVSIKVY